MAQIIKKIACPGSSGISPKKQGSVLRSKDLKLIAYTFILC